MEADFLKYLDKKHSRYLRDKKIENKGFILYFSLRPLDMDTNENFVLAKSRKTRILILHEKIWVDLTDIDIINIICNLDDKIAKQLLEELKKCYENNWTAFGFCIDASEYQGKGIDYSKFDLEKIITLEADFDIKLKDLLFIINMILFKDVQGQKYVEREDELALIDRTLIKYISLILYYKFECSEAAEYLYSIAYPIIKKEDLLKEKMKVKKYDKKFTKIGFDKIKNLC